MNYGIFLGRERSMDDMDKSAILEEINNFIKNDSIAIDDLFTSIMEKRGSTTKCHLFCDCIKILSQEDKEKYLSKIVENFMEWMQSNEFFVYDQEQYLDSKENEILTLDSCLNEIGYSRYSYNDWMLLIPMSVYIISKEKFINICECIHFAQIVGNLLSQVFLMDKNGFVELVKYINFSVYDNEGSKWNGSMIAPIFLNIIVNNYEVAQDSFEWQEEFIKKLKKNDNTIFLLWNYTKYIVTHYNRKKNALSQLICFLKKYNVDDKQLQEVYKSYSCNIKNDRELFTCIIVASAFSDKFAGQYLINDFERALCTSSEGFLNAGCLSIEIQSILSKIYMDSGDCNTIIALWKNSWNILATKFYNTYFDYYSNEAAALRKNRLLLLNIGIAICQKMVKWDSESHEIWEMYNQLYEYFMILIQYDSRYGIDYIDGLKNLLDIKINHANDVDDEKLNNEIYQSIIKIKSHPVVFIKIIYYLTHRDCNRLNFSKGYVHKLYNAFRYAAKFAYVYPDKKIKEEIKAIYKKY